MEKVFIFSVSFNPKGNDVIFNSRKSLLYHNDDPQVKKDTSVEYDVTMGSYDDAVLSEIVGMFIIGMLSKSFEQDYISLYKDDGLSVFRNYNGHLNDKIRKDHIKLFKKYQFNLHIKYNLKLAAFLKMSFEMNTGIYKPFKPIYKPITSHYILMQTQCIYHLS